VNNTGRKAYQVMPSFAGQYKKLLCSNLIIEMSSIMINFCFIFCKVRFVLSVCDPRKPKEMINPFSFGQLIERACAVIFFVRRYKPYFSNGKSAVTISFFKISAIVPSLDGFFHPNPENLLIKFYAKSLLRAHKNCFCRLIVQHVFGAQMAHV